MHVDPRDKRWSKLVRWLANEHTILAETLGRKPTTVEHRAHAHAFIDMVFDDEEKLWADLAARKAQAPPARHPPDPEMAEGGRPHRRDVKALTCTWTLGISVGLSWFVGSPTSTKS